MAAVTIESLETGCTFVSVGIATGVEVAVLAGETAAGVSLDCGVGDGSVL